MATFLDITGLQHFSSLFVFVFSWALLYSLFIMSKVFAGNKVTPAIVSFVLSVFIILNPFVLETVQGVAPWIGLTLVLLMVLLPSLKAVAPSLEENTAVVRVIVVFILLFAIIISIVVRLRAEIPDLDEESEDLSKARNVILHPKMLGAIVLLVVAILTVSLMTTSKI